MMASSGQDSHDQSSKGHDQGEDEQDSGRETTKRRRHGLIEKRPCPIDEGASVQL